MRVSEYGSLCSLSQNVRSVTTTLMNSTQEVAAAYLFDTSSLSPFLMLDTSWVLGTPSPGPLGASGVASTATFREMKMTALSYGSQAKKLTLKKKIKLMQTEGNFSRPVLPCPQVLLT